MSVSENPQRRRSNRRKDGSTVIRVELRDGAGNPRWVTADVVDRSEDGLGISLMAPVKIGSTISLRGKLAPDGSDAKVEATVVWCEETSLGSFRVGLELAAGPRSSKLEDAEPIDCDPDELDCYEIMQLSPNADSETITRVYRILAQRYHPDNAETGNAELFMKLTQAHDILSNSQRRASYDARHRALKQLHWKIFERPNVTAGREAELRKRRGILELLYASTLEDPARASLTILNFEQLLGCPREHLEAALWYLRGKGLIQRGDNGKYAITVAGFDVAEQQGATPHAPITRQIEQHRN